MTIDTTTYDDYGAHDAILERLAPYGPSLANGLFDHAPMVVEALAALGQGAHADAWIDRYGRGFAERGEPGAIATPAEIDELVGDRDAYERLAATLRVELVDGDWRTVLAHWCERLAPGFVTAACHGVLRTAHATRALAERDTPARRRELADAIAAWASAYLTLPVALAATTAQSRIADALAALSPVPEDQRPGRGLLMAAYGAVAHCPDFAAQVAAADLAGDVRERADDLASAFAARFLTSASDDFEAIALTHCITGAVAVARLAPHLPEPTSRQLLARAWEGGCALVASFGQSTAPGDVTAPTPKGAPTPDDLPVRARTHGDDHVIKLTEACLEVFRRNGDDTLLAAAERAHALLPELAPAP